MVPVKEFGGSRSMEEFGGSRSMDCSSSSLTHSSCWVRFPLPKSPKVDVLTFNGSGDVMN